MGQKIHPIGFRLSVQRNWTSRWYSNSKNFPGMLHEDIKVRDFLKKKLAHAAVSKVVIERPAKNAKRYESLDYLSPLRPLRALPFAALAFIFIFLIVT